MDARLRDRLTIIAACLLASAAIVDIAAAQRTIASVSQAVSSFEMPGPSDAISDADRRVNPTLPEPQVNAPEPLPASRLDLYGGYAFLKPSGSIGAYSYDSIDEGAVVSATGFLTRHLGLQAESGLHPNGPNDCIFTVQAGPLYRFFSGDRLLPFVHATAGTAKVGGPKFQPCTWGYGLTVGGGLDYLLPGLRDRMAVRILQADYEYMHVDYGALQPYDLSGGVADINAVRLSAGLVLRLGGSTPKLEKSLSCDVDPQEVYSGEKITLAAVTRNYSPQRQYLYRWELSGGKVNGYGPAVFVDTTGLDEGSYTATVHVSKSAKAKQEAQCSSTFTIKRSPAPEIRCSGNPAAIHPGDTSVITSYATTIPQRTLTYSFSASAGQIGGHDAVAQLHTDGVAPGQITVTCRVQDDLGQPAQATTEVTVLAPVVPPVPKAQKMCTLSFDRDLRRPARVDNEGRACLDDIALTLQHRPEARLVVVGEHGGNEEDGQMIAAERAVNTRAYLSKEKGVDPARVDLRTSSTPGRQVETYLLEPGAVFDQPTEGRVDESKVKIHGQQYASERSHRRSTEGPAGEGVSHPPKQP